MSIPIRHHYLPKFYLEGFCRNNNLWVFDRDLNEYREQTPKNTAILKHYYNFSDENDELITGIEIALSEVEGKSSSIIRKLENRNPISQSDREVLSLFLALMRVRIPDFEKEFHDLTDTFVKEINQIVFATEESTRSVLQEIESETGETLEISPQEIMEIAKEQEYEIQHERIHSLGIMFPLAIDLAELLMKMDWQILISPENSSYITSDNPFVIIPPRNIDPIKRRAGIAIQGAQKYIPLSQKICIVILDEGVRIGFTIISREQVRQVNLNTALNCKRFVIARDDALLRRVIKTTGIDKYKKNRKWIPSKR